MIIIYRKIREMKTYLILLCLITLGCNSIDHIDDLTVYNNLKEERVEIIFGPDENYQPDLKPVTGNNGKIYYQTFIEPGQIAKVGTVKRNYVPHADDLYVNYIELRYAGDTIILKGKKAIYTSFYNDEGKFWRYKVK